MSDIEPKGTPTGLTSPDTPSTRGYHSPLPRLTRRVFTDLAIWMTGLGLLMGVAFPFFVLVLGVPDQYVFTPLFFVATIGAGLTGRQIAVAFHAVQDVHGRRDAPAVHVR